jgi:hypothetical protein
MDGRMERQRRRERAWPQRYKGNLNMMRNTESGNHENTSQCEADKNNAQSNMVMTWREKERESNR